MARFWRPILVSACNEELDRISCTHAFKIFRDGFLAHPRGFHFGVPRVPLGTLYTEPTLAYLRRCGGCVRLRTIVESIDFERGPAGGVTSVTLQDGERLTADYYVSALQFDLLLKLLPPEVTAGVPYWENLRSIELSPIMGVHLWFDRPHRLPARAGDAGPRHRVDLQQDCTVWRPGGRGRGVGHPAIRSAREGAGTGVEGTGHPVSPTHPITQSPSHPITPDPRPPTPASETYLSLVMSASRRYAGMPQEEIVALALRDVEACLPDTRQARLLRSRVIRWPKATFSPKPGVKALRPDQRSPISNLYVAGEWTQTGWPSTMESAARSGYRAAEYLLAYASMPRQSPRPRPAAVLAGSAPGARILGTLPPKPGE